MDLGLAAVERLAVSTAHPQAETAIAWHRKGFRRYWSWKSWRREGRQPIGPEVRNLIRQMSLANPRWGAPRIHGDLLKIGIELSQVTVAKNMVRHRKRPSQTWRTFLESHVKDLASADFFVVPTVCFKMLFVIVILAPDRRWPIQVAVTAYPTAEWVAQQVLEVVPWDPVIWSGIEMGVTGRGSVRLHSGWAFWRF